MINNTANKPCRIGFYISSFRPGSHGSTDFTKQTFCLSFLELPLSTWKLEEQTKCSNPATPVSGAKMHKCIKNKKQGLEFKRKTNAHFDCRLD